MLSDSVFEAIDDILEAVTRYNDYSGEHKKRIVLALAHLYMIQWTLDNTRGNMNSTFTDAQRYASIEFDKALHSQID